VSAPREPQPTGDIPANDNERPGPRLKAELRLPKGMPVQIVEVEVLAELLELLPPPANDNEECDQ
jgi:hypothetical protein